ncbi:MAG: hypothetical protein JJ900_11810 [Rhodospirillales bacterium]|nr:hypothetical protein [Rhodospirillales bacterium]MBO6787527.1 hypothetical protein [Rhodospirillales bacterium]
MRGRITLDDMQGSIQDFARHPDFRLNLDRLVLAYDDLDISDSFLKNMFTIKEEMVAEYFGGDIPQMGKGPLYKTAIVTSSTGNELITRLFQAVLDADMPSVVALKTFRELHDALSWLDRADLPQEELEPELGTFLTTD